MDPHNILNNNENIENNPFKSEINLIYHSDEEEVKDIFGKIFVDNNKCNIE